MRHHSTGPVPPVRRIAPLGPVAPHRRGVPALAALAAAVRKFRAKPRAPSLRQQPGHAPPQR